MPADGILVAVTTSGPRHVPLAARVKCYQILDRMEGARRHLLQCTSPLLAHRTRAATSAFPTLLGEQRKCPGDRQSDANDPLRSFHDGALCSAVLFSLRKRHGDLAS